MAGFILLEGQIMRPLDKILNNLRSFAIDMANDPGDTSAEPFVPEVMFSVGDLGALALSGEEAQKYRAFVHDLHARYQDRASQAGIAKLVQRAILRTMDITGQHPDVPADQRAADAIKDLRSALNQDPRQRLTYFPLAGLCGLHAPWKVGNVMLLPGTPPVLSEIFRIPQSIIASTPNSDHDKLRLQQMVYTQCIDPLRNRVVAAVPSAALDDDAAYSLAKRRLRFLLDCLNFYADLVQRPSLHCQLSDWPRPPLARHVLMIEETDGTTLKSHARGEQLGPMADIDAAILQGETGQKLGVPRLLEVLSREKPDSLEERILTSLQWAGRAAVESRPEQAFLLLAIALESVVLGPKEDVELTLRLAQRVAHLLGGTVDARKKIASETRRLYRLRSKIVHSGAYEVPPEDLQLLRAYVKRLFLRLLTDETFTSMRSEEDLDDWFDHVLMAGGVAR